MKKFPFIFIFALISSYPSFGQVRFEDQKKVIEIMLSDSSLNVFFKDKDSVIICRAIKNDSFYYTKNNRKLKVVFKSNCPSNGNHITFNTFISFKNAVFFSVNLYRRTVTYSAILVRKNDILSILDKNVIFIKAPN